MVAAKPFFGKPTGPAIQAYAEPLVGAEADRAGHLIERNCPIRQDTLAPLAHRLRRLTTTHADLTPVEAVVNSASS
jgi:hypothetical protein